MARHRHSFLYRHSLSMVAVGLLIVWIVGYRMLDPKTHLGAFFGNAIADWSGSVIIILGTKFLYEVGSPESRPVKEKERSAWLDFLHRHSLLIFIVITGIGWAFLFASMNAESKWGQVVGNILSEWVQMAGLVFLTKRLIEIGSKKAAANGERAEPDRHWWTQKTAVGDSCYKLIAGDTPATTVRSLQITSDPRK